jgi:hypothetical protein
MQQNASEVTPRPFAFPVRTTSQNKSSQIMAAAPGAAPAASMASAISVPAQFMARLQAQFL